MTNPTDTNAWKALLEHAGEFKMDGFRLRDLFDAFPGRFENFSLSQDQLLLDYSKNFLTEETITLLNDLARECDVPEAIEAMFKGEKINNTEGRAALHTALRIPEADNPHTEVNQALDKMAAFVSAIHSGQWLGYSGKPITDVVNIGIGGSDLGPAMVSDALSDFATEKLKVHYVSNVDPSHLASTLAPLNAETTLFIIASKSFTTLETHQNANAARRWFLGEANKESEIARHFVAISSNLEAAAKFGIDSDNLFPMWDWVGGRYSLWSAIGLSIALAIGMEKFHQLLAGAHAMDKHFRTAELEENLPVIMALITVWYTGFFDCHSTAVVPYSQRLNLLPSYLQQLYMESLGKNRNKSNQPVTSNTGEVLWGSAGTNGQHSYFQLLHQGTQFVPIDFIAVATPAHKGEEREGAEAHQHLLANCLGQSLALMEGQIDDAAPYRNMPGNRPSNTLVLSKLTPYSLGSLIALYEHKTYVQSVIWNINAFDQWGVELGKAMSQQLFEILLNPESGNTLDESTIGLITHIKKMEKN